MSSSRTVTRLFSVALIAMLLLTSLSFSAQAQDGPVPQPAEKSLKADCAPLDGAEQQEFDSLTAMKAAETLAGANLARYDALAQQINCYNAQLAAPGPAEAKPAGATWRAPTVTKTVGTTGADYATLAAAFTDINNGVLTGAIQLDVIDNTTEPATGAILNASGSGSASYTAVLIQPSGGAARTISGAATAGLPLVDLNGADNVTIDGLNTGGNSLTIANTTVSATSGTSTIRFQTDATNNTITRASILGSSTMATTTNGGTIYFGAAAITTGNDNNVISNCNIGPTGANLPTKAIYGNGSTTSTATYNSGNQITGNNIYDYFNAAAQANAVYLAGANTAWTISNNRIYQTATRTQTTGAILAGIQAASATGKQTHAERILRTLQADLHMEEVPLWIECFDNSNLQGTNPVSSSVVFRNAKPAKRDYRHYNVKTVEGPNDFASMEEVVFRRYKRLLAEGQGLPQLVIIDGGKGQLGAAMKSLRALGLEGKMTVIGIAKRLEEIFFPDDPVPALINKKSESLKLIQQARNEAHRFGITFHRNQRSKNFIKTELTEIPGIGAKTAEKLLQHFGSLTRLREAEVADMEKVVGKAAAGKVREYFSETAETEPAREDGLPEF